MMYTRHPCIYAIIPPLLDNDQSQDTNRHTGAVHWVVYVVMQ